MYNSQKPANNAKVRLRQEVYDNLNKKNRNRNRNQYYYQGADQDQVEDGVVVRLRSGNDNYNNYNNRNQKPRYNSTPVVKLRSDYDEEDSSIRLRTFDDVDERSFDNGPQIKLITDQKNDRRNDRRQDRSQNVPKKENYDEEKALLNAYLDEYTSEAVRKDPSVQRDILVRDIIDVAKIMTHYGDSKYESLWGEMNGVLSLMTPIHFAQNLRLAIRDEEIQENWEETWNYVARLISTLLATSRDMMKDETIHMYIWDMLASKGMWGLEIEKLMNDIHITKELATELVVKIPVPVADMKTKDIADYAPAFIDAILAHAEDNIDTINAETQGKIFQFFFGTETTGVKALGRMMTQKIMVGLDTIDKIVYEEYIKMLYVRLNSYDINDIMMALRFIGRTRKENPTDEMVYNPTKAAEYDNIRKALMKIIGNTNNPKDKEIANFLA